MLSIYENYVSRAKSPIQPDPVDPKDMAIILKILSPVLGLAAELRRERFLTSDEERRETASGIEFRWRLSESRFLVVHGLAPILTTGVITQARIVAGVSDGNAVFFGMPGCGWYPIPTDETDGLRTHWLILEAVADLVAPYRTESNC
jgi:hypothetical protein